VSLFYIYPAVLFCIDFIVGEICVHCIPYNLVIFNVKRNHYTAEFKKMVIDLQKKSRILLCSSITGSMKLIQQNPSSWTPLYPGYPSILDTFNWNRRISYNFTCPKCAIFWTPLLL
jgi:hypothetical protein